MKVKIPNPFRRKGESRWHIIKAMDAFAVFYIEPTYFGAFLTIVGLVGLAAYIGFLIDKWTTNPTISVATILPTEGNIYTLHVKCNSGPCDFRTYFGDDSFCNDEVPLRDFSLDAGEEGEIKLCYSTTYTAGYKVTIPFGALSTLVTPPVSFYARKGGALLPFPPVDGSARRRVIVTMRYLNQVNTLNDTQSEFWTLANVIDYGLSCSDDVGLNPFAVCYLLQIEPIFTEIRIVRPFDWFQILAELGGAKGAIFSIIGIVAAMRRAHMSYLERKKEYDKSKSFIDLGKK